MIENGTVENLDCGCVISKDKNKSYHRLDGPAIDRSRCHLTNLQSEVLFFIHDEEFTKEGHTRRVEEMKQEALKEIEDMLIKCYAWIIVQRKDFLSPERVKARRLYYAWSNLGAKEWDPDVMEQIRDHMLQRGLDHPN